MKVDDDGLKAKVMADLVSAMTEIYRLQEIIERCLQPGYVPEDPNPDVGWSMAPNVACPICHAGAFFDRADYMDTAKKITNAIGRIEHKDDCYWTNLTGIETPAPPATETPDVPVALVELFQLQMWAEFERMMGRVPMWVGISIKNIKDTLLRHIREK